MKTWVRETLLFGATFVCTTLFANSSLMEPVGLRLQDALQRAWPIGQARYCKVVSITRGDYEERFGGAPNPQELKIIVARLLEFRPAVLAIDIDTSSTQYAKVNFAFPPGPTRIVWSRTLVGAGDPDTIGSGAPDVILGHPEHDPLYSGVSYYRHDLDGKYRVFDRVVPNGSRTLNTFHWAVVKAYCEFALSGARGSEVPPAVCSSLQLQERAEIPPVRPRFRQYGELFHPLEHVLDASVPRSGNFLEGQVVILGGEYDDQYRLETPLGRQFSDRIIGQLVEAELRDDILRDLPRWAGYTIELAIGLLIVAIYRLFPARPEQALLLSAVLGCVVATSTLAAYYLGAFWLDAGVFFVAIVIEQCVEAFRTTVDLARDVRKGKTSA